ncbi:flagellar protein FliT [Cupriavidus basilensis]|uniref:flagellar protein FliT n=1 Tax=Cupriavidus basilensis TaxID=68895 RepID=UPI0020A63C2E|nr:flagellar protein FliT [Cupriavidus basilensis]MCP3018877.1 flagellar protein FliT [Cupriavidus basilensis]MDR3384297.1 flagellar protein FliT [Cupriavidus basilensis]
MLQQKKQIIACYEELMRLSGLMCEAARAGRWDTLCALQTAYVAQVNTLKSIDDVASLSAEERRYRYRMLETILSQDAAIRNLVTPKMEELGYLLNNSRRRQELHHAYGSPA